ncbi:hypothetical protein TRIP_B200150 [uncultured Desulfatiglans sp.]|uniref:Uncharacterized protein n=1 Tax=Uncultured Desulfatiglans sp. TaxID=1748965 RepID=A0A653A1W1_UNCDX|nr:hypothetical protein TRIP_B200150 [uncultured Desulfatiglans sp.]
MNKSSFPDGKRGCAGKSFPDGHESSRGSWSNLVGLVEKIVPTVKDENVQPA